MRQMRGMTLERRLELWARWIVTGCNSSRGGFASMLEMMMVTRCQFSGGGGEPGRDRDGSGGGCYVADGRG